MNLIVGAAKDIGEESTDRGEYQKSTPQTLTWQIINPKAVGSTIIMNNHCCEAMKDQVNINCMIHANPFDCPDILINYNKRFDEYGLLIHDGGSSSIEITYCPWCGTKLPDSKRDLWFEILEQLGFDDAVEQSIPEEFETDKWYKNSK